MKKRNKGLESLFFREVRPMCIEKGCTNKARRIGKRKYSDTCHLHKRMYTAA